VIPPATTIKKLIILFRQHQYEDIESLQGELSSKRHRRHKITQCLTHCFSTMTQDDTSIHSSKAESDLVCRIQGYQLFEKYRKFQSILKIKPLCFCRLGMLSILTQVNTNIVLSFLAFNK